MDDDWRSDEECVNQHNKRTRDLCLYTRRSYGFKFRCTSMIVRHGKVYLPLEKSMLHPDRQEHRAIPGRIFWSATEADAKPPA